MKTKAFVATLILILVLGAVLWFSCPSNRQYVLSGVSGDQILVSRDRETMETIIDCAITRRCDDPSSTRIVLENGLFTAEKGTAVSLLEGFTFSPAKHIRILHGIHAGEVGWVSDRMLQQSDARTQSSPTKPVSSQKAQSAGKRNGEICG